MVYITAIRDLNGAAISQEGGSGLQEEEWWFRNCITELLGVFTGIQMVSKAFAVKYLMDLPKVPANSYNLFTWSQERTSRHGLN